MPALIFVGASGQAHRWEGFILLVHTEIGWRRLPKVCSSMRIAMYHMLNESPIWTLLLPMVVHVVVLKTCFSPQSF